MHFNPAAFDALVTAVRKSENSKDAQVLMDSVEAISEYLSQKTAFDTKVKLIPTIHTEPKKQEIYLRSLKNSLYAQRRKADAHLGFLRTIALEYKTGAICDKSGYSVNETYDFYVELANYLREATNDSLFLF